MCLHMRQHKGQYRQTVMYSVVVYVSQNRIRYKCLCHFARRHCASQRCVLLWSLAVQSTEHRTTTALQVDNDKVVIRRLVSVQRHR